MAAELSDLPGKVLEVEQQLSLKETKLAEAEEALRQAEIRVEKADEQVKVTVEGKKWLGEKVMRQKKTRTV